MITGSSHPTVLSVVVPSIWMQTETNLLEGPMTANALRVAAAGFFRVECDHAQLFQPEYKRSNRTKGLKILRCFPHCCPEHIDRSYCGTSLSVRVEIEDRDAKNGAAASASASGATPSTANPQEETPADRISLFARFEALHDVSLREGECVEVHKLQAAVQTEANLEGQWIPGILDRPSGLVTTIRPPAPAPASSTHDVNKPLVFHLNSKAFSRWYYDWESGANKAQRLMKHVLKAYVMERCAVDADDNFTPATSKAARTQLYRVIAVISSPEFTVISYRRAPSDANAGVLNPAPSTPSTLPPHSHHHHQSLHHHHSAMAASRYYQQGRDYQSESPYYGQVVPQRGVADQRQYSWASAAKEEGQSPFKRMRGREVETYGATPPEQKAWGPPSGAPSSYSALSGGSVTAAAAATSKNMALLLSFLQWAPLSVYSPFVEDLNQLLHHKLVNIVGVRGGSAATPNEEDSTRIPNVRTNCFSRTILEQAARGNSSSNNSGSTSASSGRGISYDIETLLRVVAQTALWLFSRETRMWLRSFLAHHSPAVLNKRNLRGAYFLFLRELEQLLNAQVFSATPLGSLDNAAEEVIATVYSLERFHDKRPSVRRILSAQGFFGWSMFVAQMREVFMSGDRGRKRSRAAARESSSVPPVPSTIPLLVQYPPQCVLEECWTGEWVLEADEASWRPAMVVPPASPSDTSLWRVLSFMMQLSRVQVVLGIRDRLLCLRSTEGIASRADSARFILDGRDRVFPIFMDGVSTCASCLGESGDTSSDGDYIGTVQSEGENRLVVYLQLFRWSLADGERSYYTRLRLECWRDQRLYVNGEVLETSIPSAFTTEERAVMTEMRLRGKRKAIGKAHARYLRTEAANAPTSPVGVNTSSPWRELGKFRLSYTKV